MSNEDAIAALALWKREPVDFVRDNFGVEPDEFQITVLNWYRDGETHIAMQACKGPGKTCVLAWIMWHFMLHENANVAGISTSGANVRNNLWKELALWRDKCPWLKQAYQMTATRIYVESTAEKDYERTWFCEMRTWSKTADDAAIAQTLQGLHATFVMVVLDESGGMPDGIMVAAEGIFANHVKGDGSLAHIIQAGNPTMLKGPLYRAATSERSHWKVIEITGDPLDPKRCKRISLEWAEKQINLYGREHPWVLVNVMGKFPPASFNALIGPDDLRAAVGRNLAISQFDRAAKVIGVDVARYGDDATVIWPRQGLAAFQATTMRNAHPDDVAGQIMTLMEEWHADAVMVDATGGFGDGVVDSLGRIGITAIRVQFAGKPIDAKFYNKRSEILWNLVQWIKNGGALAPGEFSDKLVEELTQIEYTFRGDKILIEEKELVKAKIGRSPDYSDALACSFAFPVTPRERDILEGLARGSFNKALTDYDPLNRP
jgi:phage terminase large subunit